MNPTPLADRRCAPCTSDTPALLPEEVAAYAEQVPGWTVDDNLKVHRSYRFRDFASGLAFVNRIGEVAEAEDHHPDLFLAWGLVQVTIWTHAINGLSENDFILAAKIDALAQDAPGRRGQ